jgi:hypothetical protein
MRAATLDTAAGEPETTQSPPRASGPCQEGRCLMPLVNAHYPAINPTGCAPAPRPARTPSRCPKVLAAGDLAIAATGVELSVMIPLVVGTVVTSITFVTGGTAAGTPTAGYVVLRTRPGCEAGPVRRLHLDRPGGEHRVHGRLATAQLISATGLYRFGISFTATTVPTLRGVSLGNAALTASGTTIAVTHGSAVGGVAPATTARRRTRPSCPTSESPDPRRYLPRHV